MSESKCSICGMAATVIEVARPAFPGSVGRELPFCAEHAGAGRALYEPFFLVTDEVFWTVVTYTPPEDPPPAPDWEEWPDDPRRFED